MNGDYMRKMTKDELRRKIIAFIGNGYDEALIEKTIPLIQERIKKLSDYIPLCEFFFKRPDQYEVDLSSKKELLEKVTEKLERVKDWKAETIGEAMVDVAKELGVKNSEFFMVLRVAISGKKISPPLNESMELLGKEECLQRIVALKI
jgi:glutamyl/glutaminyl-tRNA synthetase